VGTVLHAQQVRDSVAAGARFVVSPSVRPSVADEAAVQAIPFVLGAWTPTEVAWAIDLASSAVKIFPAEIGGPEHLKALRGPFNKTLFIPSGGVTIQNASEWLRAGAGAISIGSSVLSAEALREGDVTDIATKARALVEVVRSFRNG
jgi:2-dehydro-3-deoxyphosphogluconate aldolase/(4S)-4-hydroxy-2-oxoglutarate aldolase